MPGLGVKATHRSEMSTRLVVAEASSDARAGQDGAV